MFRFIAYFEVCLLQKIIRRQNRILWVGRCKMT